MTTYNWEQAPVHFYLGDKKAIWALNEPGRGHAQARSISVPGHQLGFEFVLSSERQTANNYRYDNEGLVLVDSSPAYALQVAQLDDIQTFAEFDWKLLAENSRRTEDDNFQRTETFGFRQKHPYEGPIDGVMKFETVSYEGDCGPMSTFEAFFYQGRLVAGWDSNHPSRDRRERALTSCHGLTAVLNQAGRRPHPSEEEVKRFMRESNIPRTTLQRFEEFLTQ